MKWKGWIGGVLLVMMLFGTLGCGKKRGPVTGGMVDGPGMMYTPEDQSPFAGTWQSRDGSIVMEVESRGQFEASGIQVLVNGEPDFASDAWVYKTGNVKLTQEHKDIPMTGTFNRLTFSHKENAFCVHYSDGSGLIWLTRDGAACGEEDVIFSPEPETPPSRERSCPACRAENEGSFCTGCGLAKPLTCEACGWQPKPALRPRHTARNAATVSNETCRYMHIQIGRNNRRKQ